MQRILFLIFITSFTAIQAQEVSFGRYFENKTLRVDYIHSGDSDSHHYALDEIFEEPFWGGSKTNLIDTLRYGHYFFEMIDQTSDSVIYSRGYSTLFREWQTTAEAKQITKAFSETVVMPYPKNDVTIKFYSRDKHNHFVESYSVDIDPDSYFIRPNTRMVYPSFSAHHSGDPSNKVDILILPEGYTKEEMGRFIEDCNQFAEDLFTYEPYTSNRDKFNIAGILAPSAESGSDIPAEGIYKNTILNSSFYTFDSERYCMTKDNKAVRDLATNAPYDQIYILINTEKYGGGAIYNHFNMSVNSNAMAAKIFVHEFGHGFAGLGDEYYNSSVAYSDFYDIQAEPWEPNLTTLVDFHGKWEDMILEGVPVPTPPRKKYKNKLGVFEGGGYVAKGVYRPAYDCLMNSFNGDKFCGACEKSIQLMIDFYTE